MAVNKVEFGDQVVMDITDSTVSPEKLLSGETAYDRSGAKITGSLVAKDITVTPKRDTGENIATITIDDTDHDIYALSEEEVIDLISGEQEATGNPVVLKTLIGGKAKTAEVTFLPKQDLHGYDKPWPAGGGKNKFNYEWITDIGCYHGTVSTSANGNITITATSNDAYTEFIASHWDNAYRIAVKENDVVRLSWNKSGATGRCGIFSEGDTKFGYKTIENSTGLVTYTIPEGVTFVTIRFGVANSGESCTYSNVMVTVNNSSTDYATYSNICPISGWTEVNLTRTGKNLFDKNNTEGGYLGADGSVVSSGSFDHEYISIVGGQTYTISGVNNNGGPYSWWYDDSMAPISFFTRHKNGTFTAPINAKYMGINAIVMSNTMHDIDTIQVENGTTPTTYEPYQGETYTEPLGATYYGGKVDFVSGKLTIDTKYSLFDGTESGWTTRTGGAGQLFEKTLTESITQSDTQIGKCNELNWNNYLITEYSYRIRNTTLAVCLPSSYSTVDSFQSWLESNNLQITYPLNTPIEVTLTPQEIELLKGANVLWSDSNGNILIKWQNIPDIEKLVGNTIEGTLTAGSTSLTLQSDKITEDSTLDIYTNKYGVNPTDITVTNGQAVLTFESQSTDLKVKVKVM